MTLVDGFCSGGLTLCFSFSSIADHSEEEKLVRSIHSSSVLPFPGSDREAELEPIPADCVLDGGQIRHTPTLMWTHAQINTIWIIWWAFMKYWCLLKQKYDVVNRKSYFSYFLASGCFIVFQQKQSVGLWLSLGAVPVRLKWKHINNCPEWRGNVKGLQCWPSFLSQQNKWWKSLVFQKRNDNIQLKGLIKKLPMCDLSVENCAVLSQYCHKMHKRLFKNGHLVFSKVINKRPFPSENVWN